MLGEGNTAMTKRIKSSDIVKARKETKRLQRQAQTRIRKATKIAERAGDNNALKKIQEIQRKNSKVLSNKNEGGLPLAFKHNVMREKGRAMRLNSLLTKNTVLSQKRQKKVVRKTFEKLFGKNKTSSLLKTLGGTQMSRLSGEFWEQMYKAQDMLYAEGIVPVTEIMGRFGSIGSGLLETGKQLVNDGFWERVTFGLETDSEGSSASTDLVVKFEDKKIETDELPDAIVKWYKAQYGLE